MKESSRDKFQLIIYMPSCPKSLRQLTWPKFLAILCIAVCLISAFCAYFFLKDDLSTNYLVVSGYTIIGHHDFVEVVNIKNGKTCQLADFPLSVSGPLSMEYQGMPLVCGGWADDRVRKECFTYENQRNIWKQQHFELDIARVNGNCILMNKQ